jgi:hypothetical protein
VIGQEDIFLPPGTFQGGSDVILVSLAERTVTTWSTINPFQPPRSYRTSGPNTYVLPGAATVLRVISQDHLTIGGTTYNRVL